MRSTAAARRSPPRTASRTRGSRWRSGSPSGPRTTSDTSGTCTTVSIPVAPCIPAGLPVSPPTRKSRSVSSIARRASGRSSLGLRRLALAALIALGTGSLLFDLTLSRRAWDLQGAPIAADLTRSTEQHEVDYVARPCLPVPVGTRFTARGVAGAVLHLRGGVIGERAYDVNHPDIQVQAFADGTPVGTLDVPRTSPDGSGWRRLDAPLPPGAAERQFVFAVSSADRSRPFCLQAWTSR